MTAISVDIEGRENPIDGAERDTSESHDVTLFRKSGKGGDTSESDDDDQLSIAHAASMACASGEDSRAMAKDDHDAGSSRAVASDNQSVLHKSSARAASTGEKVPTTSPAAERSSESAVSVVQRPLPQTVRTRAFSTATNKINLSAQGRMRSSPRAPLLVLPAPPKEKARPSPVRRKEYGLTVGRGQSAGETNTCSDPAASTAIATDPGGEPGYDEQDIRGWSQW